MKDSIKYSRIYWVSFAPSVGHEFQGKRPAIVIQADASLRKTKVHHIESFDRSRFLKQIGHMTGEDMKKIRGYLTLHFGL